MRHRAVGDVSADHFLAIDPDDAAVIHIEFQPQRRNRAGIRHAKFVAQVNGGVIVPHVVKARLVVVVSVTDAGAAGFPFLVFTVVHLPPCGGAPGRRRVALFVTPHPVVVVDEDDLFPGGSARCGANGRDPPAPAEVVVEGGVDQFNRAAVPSPHRPGKLSAKLHLIDRSILPIPQDQPLPVIGQTSAVRAKRRDRKHRLQRRGIPGQHQVPARLQHGSFRKRVVDAPGEAPAGQVHRRRVAVVNFNKLLRGRLVGRLVINLVDHHARGELAGDNCARYNRQDTRDTAEAGTGGPTLHRWRDQLIFFPEQWMSVGWCGASQALGQATPRGWCWRVVLPPVPAG